MHDLIHLLDPLRELTFAGVTVRLLVALLCGGMLGLERERRHRPSGLAGLRTYMLVCLGASLTILISQYITVRLNGPWAELAAQIGVRTDMSRFGAQVINGIGFLGAGTIIVTGRQEVKGLTTAAGLWASACMGLAVGAGFFECAIFAVILILISVRYLTKLESMAVESSRALNFYVEFDSMNDIGSIIRCVKSLDARIYEVDIDRGDLKRGVNHSAVFNIGLAERRPHTEVLTAVSQLDSIISIYEI